MTDLSHRRTSFSVSLAAPQFVIVLNSNEAVAAFAKGGNVTIGGALAAAAGPVGVGGAVNTAISSKPAPMFTYSKSKGLFAGVSLEGTVLIERVRSCPDAKLVRPLIFAILMITERRQ